MNLVDGAGTLSDQATEQPGRLKIAKGLARMAKNIGPEDRVVRIVVGIGLAILAYMQVLPGVPTIIMWVAAAYLILTGLLARCVVYKMVDVDTSIQEQPYSSTDDRAGF